MTDRVPLSVLDLSPFGAGQTPADGLRASVALARRAEQLGYVRYWLAEHHLNPGIAGAAPHVLLASIADATGHIRVGTAATIIGNSSALQVVEAAGVISALHPRRFDLGIGRSGSTGSARKHGFPARHTDKIVDGLLLPATRPFAFDSDRFTAQSRLLRRTAGDADRFEDDVTGRRLCRRATRHPSPRDRRGRAADHHHHPRSCRPRAFVRTARPGVGTRCEHPAARCPRSGASVGTPACPRRARPLPRSQAGQG